MMANMHCPNAVALFDPGLILAPIPDVPEDGELGSMNRFILEV